MLGVTLICGHNWLRRGLYPLLLIIGFTMMGWFFEGLRSERNETVELTGASTQQANHPFGHVGLFGILGNDNSLGLTKLEEIAEAVAEHAGANVTMGQPEYHEAAQDLFFNYLLEHPLEYSSILFAKIMPIANFAAQRLIPREFSNNAKLGITIGLWLLVVTSIGLVAFIGNWEQRVMALTLGAVTLGCFVPPVLTVPYYSFGLTVLLHLSVCVGVIFASGQLQGWQKAPTSV
jgi:hypothetical protein